MHQQDGENICAATIVSVSVFNEAGSRPMKQRLGWCAYCSLMVLPRCCTTHYLDLQGWRTPENTPKGQANSGDSAFCRGHGPGHLQTSTLGCGSIAGFLPLSLALDLLTSNAGVTWSKTFKGEPNRSSCERDKKAIGMMVVLVDVVSLPQSILYAKLQTRQAKYQVTPLQNPRLEQRV